MFAVRAITTIMLLIAASFGDFVDRLLAAPLPPTRGAELISINRGELGFYESNWTILGTWHRNCSVTYDELLTLKARLQPRDCPTELHGIRVAYYTHERGFYLWVPPKTDKEQIERLEELLKEIRSRSERDR